jgi:hypothetical protein
MPENKNPSYEIMKCGLTCPNYHIKLETGNWCWGQGLPPRRVKEGDECHRDYIGKDIERLAQNKEQSTGKLCSFKSLTIIGTVGPI